jgi:hypothetical protein
MMKAWSTHLDMQLFTQGIDHRDAHTMQAATHAVPAAAAVAVLFTAPKLAARMQHSEHRL